MSELHPPGGHHVKAVAYLISVAGPESCPEEYASCSLYAGYSENPEKRLPRHWESKNVVAELMRKYGSVYLVPIFEGISAACHDFEAMMIELCKRGSLKLKLCNERPGEWSSKTLKEICCNENHLEHADTLLALEKLIIEAMGKPEKMFSSRVLQPGEANHLDEC